MGSGLPKDLRFAPAKQPFRSGVPHADKSIGIQSRNGHRGSLHHGLDQFVGFAQVLVSLLALQGGAEGPRCRAQSLRFHARPLARAQAVVKADETPPRFTHKDRHSDNGLNILPFQMPPGQFRKVGDHPLANFPLPQLFHPLLQVGFLLQEKFWSSGLSICGVIPGAAHSYRWLVSRSPSGPGWFSKDISPAHRHGLPQPLQNGLNVLFPVTSREEFFGGKADCLQNRIAPVKGFSHLFLLGDIPVETQDRVLPAYSTVDKLTRTLMGRPSLREWTVVNPGQLSPLWTRRISSS